MKSLFRTEGPWLGAALLVVYVSWLARLAVDHENYLRGDTQGAYYGWWYTLGRSILDGTWPPFLDPVVINGGNYVAEGQIGLYNPLVALMGVGAALAPNLLVYATLLKFVVATIGVVGAYGLARSYDVRPPLASVAAAGVALCGLTWIYEAPRWFTGLLVVALLPWAWWCVRRAARGRSPLPALAAAYLVVTVGYVYGTIYLAIVLGICLLEQALERRGAGLLRVLGVGVFSGLVAIAVYLPGVLSMPVTWRRKTGFGGSGPLDMDWWHLFLISQPVGPTPPGDAADLPWRYVAWWLPLLLLVAWGPLRREIRGLVPLLAGLAMFTAWALGPFYMGPLRWPGRIMDAYTLVLVITAVVLLERGLRHRPPVGRLLLVLAVTAATALAPAAWLTGQTGERLVACAGLLVLMVVAWRVLPSRPRLGGVLLAGTLAIGLVHAAVYPFVPAPERNLPTSLSAYDDYLPGTEGAVFQIQETEGDNRPNMVNFGKTRGRHLLFGHMWRLTDEPVVNGYSTIGYLAFAKRFCPTYLGTHCGRALDEMLAVEPETGRRYVDLLSISSLVIGRNPTILRREPPDGWHVADVGPRSVTWVRDRPLPLPGGVTWVTPGSQLRVTGTGRLGTSFVLDEVPAGGARVVLSRLAWPGYRVEGAEDAGLGRRLSRMLLTVRVPESAEGEEIRVTFRPPGWRAEVAALVAAALIGLGWTGGWLRSRRRTRTGPSERSAVRTPALTT